MLIDLCNEYINNLMDYIEMMNVTVGNKAPNEKVIEIIKTNAEKQRIIRFKQDKLLNEILVPFENGKKITIDDATVLSDFAQKLSKARRDIDNAISFRCHKILLEYYKSVNDYSNIITEIFWCGICEWKYYVIATDIYRCTYFALAYEYKKYLPLLNGQGIRYYVASIINNILNYTNKDATELITLGDKILKELDEIEELYHDKYTFDMNVYRSVTYRNMTTAVASFRKGIGITSYNVSRVYELAEKCMGMISLKEETAIPYETAYLYNYYTTAFHAGKISQEQLFHELEKIVVPMDKFSESENYNRVFFYTARYLEYLSIYSVDKSAVEINGRRLLENAIAYAKNMHYNEERTMVNRYLFELISVCFQVLPIYLVEEVLLNIAIFQHKSTYIHTMVVEKICEIILDDILENEPEFLCGILDGYTIDDIKNNKNRLKKITRQMALLHDLGKYRLINIISNSSRKLEDFEFEAIKKHPYSGYKIVEKSRLSQAVKDGILYHHRFHNGKGGYPKIEKETTNQPLIDILSIADSIDAATDFLGRTYYNHKSLDDLIQEFNDYEDTRYSKVIINILKKDNVKKKIQFVLNDYRLSLICVVYKYDMEYIFKAFNENNISNNITKKYIS